MRTRILASILLVAALGLAFAAVTTLIIERQRTLTDVDARLQSRLEVARSVAAGGDDRGLGVETGTEALRLILSRVLPNSHETAIGIVGGVVRFTPGIATDIRLDRDPAFVARVVREVGTTRVWLGTASTAQGSIRYLAAPITVGGANDGSIYVAAISLDQELKAPTDSFVTLLLVSLVALVAIGVVSWFVAGRLLRPIRQLDAAASRITASDRRERIPVLGTDDVSGLTATINDMLDRLDGALTSQRQLLDDVRHELKTPITIVRGHLELLDPRDPSEVEATRAIALDELDRMSGLVDDIEALAETQRASLTLLPVDVGDLTADVFAKVRVLPGHTWMLSESADVLAQLDGARITQAWLQLVDNAAKYSPEGTTIQLGSRALDGSVELWVTDSGSGIPAEARTRIFERFGRADTGRGIRGSGLGLPIVKAIAEGHGGRVTLDTGAGGSRFGILVPTGTTAVDAEDDTDEGKRREQDSGR